MEVLAVASLFIAMLLIERSTADDCDAMLSTWLTTRYQKPSRSTEVMREAQIDIGP